MPGSARTILPRFFRLEKRGLSVTSKPCCWSFVFASSLSIPAISTGMPSPVIPTPIWMPSSVSRTGSPSAGMVTATLPGCSETTSCSTTLTPIFSSAVSALLGSEPTVPSGTPGPIDSMTVTVVPLGRRSPALTPTRPRHLPLPRALNICFFLTRKPLVSSSRDTPAAVRYRTVGTVRGPIHSSFLAARPNPVPARTTSTAMIAAMSFMRGRLADGCAAPDPVGLAGGVAEFPAGTVGGVPASPAFAANAAKPSLDAVSDALGGDGTGGCAAMLP